LFNALEAFSLDISCTMSLTFLFSLKSWMSLVRYVWLPVV
jgi:hypothetical protein